MADLSHHPGSNGERSDDTEGPGHGSIEETTPRWVYVFGIIFLVLLLLFVIVHLTGRGFGGHTL